MEALSVIWAPVGALGRVAEGRRVLLAFGVTALYALLGLVSGGISFFGGSFESQLGPGGQPPGFEDFLPYFAAFSLLLAVVFPFFLWLLVSGLMHLVTRFFGGTGAFSGTLAAVGVAQAPLVVSAAVGLPLIGLQITLGPQSTATTVVGLLNFLLGLAFIAWYAVLVVIGSALARRVGYGESAGSCAISCAGVFGLILLVGLVLVLVVVLIGQASAGSP